MKPECLELRGQLRVGRGGLLEIAPLNVQALMSCLFAFEVDFRLLDFDSAVLQLRIESLKLQLLVG